MDERVEEAISFMAARLNQPPSNSKLARVAKLSQSHFSFLFKTETKLSPAHYLMKLRMQKAAELLTQSQLSVKQVMNKVGFHDKSNFVRSFKKAYGRTPSAYRETGLGSDQSNCGS